VRLAERVRTSPYVRLAAFLAAAALYREVRISGLAGENTYNLWLFYATVVVGFWFVFGLAGQFAFSQAAFAGLGGYAYNWASRHHAFWIGLVVAIAATGALAALFALLVRRASHFYFAIATLGLGEILHLVFTKWDAFTGGLGGEAIGVRPISINGHGLTSGTQVFWFLLAALGLALLAGMLLERSPVRREVIATRDHESVAATLGTPVLRLRVSMFVLGSVVAGVAGAVFVAWKGFATPDAFGLELAIGVFLMLILGGVDSLWGPVLGAAFYVYIPEWLHRFSEYKDVIYGGLLVVAVMAVPEGLVGILHRRGKGTFPLRTPPIEAELRSASAAIRGSRLRRRERPAEDRRIALAADDVRVRFGGVLAVDGVSLELAPGEILGLVGPNGSGKSTFLNALCGLVPATGRLRVGDRDVALGRPGAIRRRGVLRTYQAPQTYVHLGCLDDVMLSTTDRRATGILAAWLARPLMHRHERDRRARSLQVLDRVGLGGLADAPVAGLAYGQRRLLELARAVAGDALVLLLDEPSAGLNDTETDDIAALLRSIRDDGTSLLVVDHKIDFIAAISDRVAVLEMGALVAVGEPGTVFDDPRVIDAYLGIG
jgi:branched-chain amino acid transport system permease protein